MHIAETLASIIQNSENMKQDKDWFDIALEHHEEENYSQAILAIQKYVELNPENKRGKLLKALIYCDLANYDLVFQILNEIKPTEEDGKDYAKLYFREIGKAYRGIGKFKKAIKYYDKIIQVAPDETVGYVFKGGCLVSMGEYELAKQEHMKATKLKGDPEEAFHNLALISRAQLKFKEAKKYCEKSLEIDPNDKSVIHCYEDILQAIKMNKNKSNKGNGS